MEKKNTRKEQAIISKQKIFNITIELIKEKGFNNVQTKDICKKAGVSVGLFYYYFKTKEDIVYEFTSNYVSDYIVDCETIKEDDLIKKLVIMFCKLAGIFEKLGFQVMIEYTNNHTSNENFVLSKTSKIFALVNQTISTPQNQYKLKEESHEITRLALILYRGLTYEWAINKDTYSFTNEVAKEMERYLWTFFEPIN